MKGWVMIAAVERRGMPTGVEAELRAMTIAVAPVRKVGAGVSAVAMLRTVTGVLLWL
jgi:hypothetical protein